MEVICTLQKTGRETEGWSCPRGPGRQQQHQKQSPGCPVSQWLLCPFPAVQLCFLTWSQIYLMLIQIQSEHALNRLSQTTVNNEGNVAPSEKFEQHLKNHHMVFPIPLDLEGTRDLPLSETSTGWMQQVQMPTEKYNIHMCFHLIHLHSAIRNSRSSVPWPSLGCSGGG